MRRMNSENIRLVGDLQDYGTPYSSLYVDVRSRKLYMFVRISSPDTEPVECAATEVSAKDVSDYMAGAVGLSHFFKSSNYGFVELGKHNIKNLPVTESLPDERMKRLDYFDSEYCHDDVWLEIFLKRLTENKPLEII